MKNSKELRMRDKRLIIAAITALTAFLYSTGPAFALVLGTAEDFAVLGGSTVTNTGSTSVKGSLGVSPGSAVVGFDQPGGPGTVTNGTIHGPDGVSLLAQTDASKAWVGLKNMASTTNLTGTDLGGLTLTSGVYHFDTSAQLTGPLQLDAQGLDNAFWNFQIGSTLTTASASSVSIINPGANSGVFWQVGSSATLGTGTSFTGNIIADQSITMTTDAKILCGRALALNGATTLDTNEINAICDQDSTSHGNSGGLVLHDDGTVGPTAGQPIVTPEPATLTLLGLGLLGGFKKFRKNKIA
jgi:hypothetical protein